MCTAPKSAILNQQYSTSDPEWKNGKRMMVTMGLILWMGYRETLFEEYKMAKDDEYEQDRKAFASGERDEADGIGEGGGIGDIGGILQRSTTLG